jgi:hypothetical protein
MGNILKKRGDIADDIASHFLSGRSKEFDYVIGN